MSIKLIFGLCFIIFFWTTAFSTSSYFEMTYGKETREGLRKEFFQCDREKSCTNVIKTKSGRFETINGEQQLREWIDISNIWKKMKIVNEIQGKGKIESVNI